MFPEYELFINRADALLLRVADLCQAAGRPRDAVTVLPVTKNHPAAAAAYAIRFGFSAVGENRVQEAAEKRASVDPRLRWELIGHLQSNKARLAVTHFSRIQSVDSLKLLAALDRVAAESGATLPVLLQINAGRDPAKFGIEPEEAPRVLEQALTLPNLRVEGLMTVAPLAADPAVARRAFANLRAIRDRLSTAFATPLAELSMGMSSDLAEAIAEGSTLLRIGSALFGRRT